MTLYFCSVINRYEYEKGNYTNSEDPEAAAISVGQIILDNSHYLTIWGYLKQPKAGSVATS
ncbi:hypothetical protein MKQ70_23915 [Chitinophaga sedimenti]|uniref:hypothetical protein n=1 Tax=Chitinophaga sedimenti TaxID=2033606 RepID=UPI002005DBFA|nr:hypothetical protein [Chitinophaga sedimenti]MCK7557888.1 hypothetical protein [Chitinophaga sedimenti]